MSTTTQPPLTQFRIPHYLTGQYTPNTTRLDDDTYAAALDSIVKCCTDIVLVDSTRSKFLLGKRTMWPQRSWWFPAGGRMRCGESIPQSINRLLSRELGLQLPQLDARIQQINNYWYLWGKREQLPQTNGTGDISVVSVISLSDTEVQQINQTEYSAMKWVSMSEILSSNTYHPALVRVVYDYIKQLLLQELESLTLYQQRLQLVPKDIDIEYIISSQPHYMYNNTATDVDATQQHWQDVALQSDSKSGKTNSHTNGDVRAMQQTQFSSTEPATADDIAAKTTLYLQFSRWLAQHDHRQVVAVEQQ